MKFSRYAIYVDESGDPSLSSIDPSYPIFALALCIFEKTAYSSVASRDIQNIKFRWFGHDGILLHEHDIVKRKPPFGFLQYDHLRDAFMDDLSAVLASAPMTVIAAVIRKDLLTKRYSRPENPYQLALLFCMEKARELLDAANDTGTCHINCESRSPREKAGRGREDRELELEFERIKAGRHVLQRNGTALANFDITFVSKQANSAGLQLADLIARPIGLSILRPGQPNRAFDIIREKLWAGPSASSPGYGLKIFP